MIPDPRRQAAIARIHVAKKALRLSDELYRAIIARVTGGKRSSAALDAAERGRLLDELRRLGFEAMDARGRSNTSPCPGRGRASIASAGEGIFDRGSTETARA